MSEEEQKYLAQIETLHHSLKEMETKSLKDKSHLKECQLNQEEYHVHQIQILDSYAKKLENKIKYLKKND